MLSRRSFLASSALFAWNSLPKAALHAGKDPRFLALILRGGLDGLSAVAPIGDPAYEAARGKIALSLNSDKPALPLDGFFALHPAMPNLHALYHAKEALVVHAVHSAYRERSHFDGQDVLESGYEKAGFVTSGWLNRAFERLEGRDLIKPPLGVGAITPLIVRGAAGITAWSPQSLPPASEDLNTRLLALYEKTDVQLAQSLQARLKMQDKSPPRTAYVVDALSGAGKFLARSDGPRLGALALDGFDTHAQEGAAIGQLANRLSALDLGLAALKTNLGAAWKDTVVVIITEFGRTAKVNGTEGTDHGSATCAFVLGGAVKGGRVHADWPTLQDNALFEKRDLKPTTDLRAVLKGLLQDHLGLDMKKHSEAIFPGSLTLKPLQGII